MEQAKKMESEFGYRLALVNNFTQAEMDVWVKAAEKNNKELLIKLVFYSTAGDGAEGMWVSLDFINDQDFVGELANAPIGDYGVERYGSVTFALANIVDVRMGGVRPIPTKQ